MSEKYFVGTARYSLCFDLDANIELETVCIGTGIDDFDFRARGFAGRHQSRVWRIARKIFVRSEHATADGFLPTIFETQLNLRIRLLLRATILDACADLQAADAARVRFRGCDPVEDLVLAYVPARRHGDTDERVGPLRPQAESRVARERGAE